MKTVILDTNVYGWSLAYSLTNDRRKEAVDSSNLINKIIQDKSKHKIQVLSCDQIVKEIKIVRKIYSELKSLHDSIITGVVKESLEINKLAMEYVNECKRKGILIIDIKDCKILASATKAQTLYFITENRKSIVRSDIIDTIKSVNKKYRLKTPEIITCEKAIKLLD